MTTNRRIRLLTALALGALLSPAAADDWPQWRGPQRTGISAEKVEPWSGANPTIAWKADIGLGFSSTVVGGGRVYATGHANENDTLSCFDADKGTTLWKHTYPSELGDKYFEGGTTGTPTIDGDRVYLLGRWGDLFCFDAATGKIRWQANLQKDGQFPIPSWGFSGAPVVFENLLVVNVGDAGVALDKMTGKVAWASAAQECGYSTPYPLRRGDETLLVIGSAKSYVAVDAKTGKEAWRVKWVTQYGVNAADPVIQGDLMFLSSGYGKGGALFRLGKGEPEVVWQNKSLATQMNAAVLIGGHLYAVDGDSDKKTFLKCVDAAAGTVKWSQPLAGGGALTAAGADLVVIGGTGDLMIAPASPDGFKTTARAPVVQGKCWSVPVVANGRIYVRSAEGQLVCVDARKKG